MSEGQHEPSPGALAAARALLHTGIMVTSLRTDELVRQAAIVIDRETGLPELLEEAEMLEELRQQAMDI